MDSKIRQHIDYYTQRGPVILLESQSPDHPSSRKSYLAADPKAVIKAHDTLISIEQKGSSRQVEGNPWDALSTFREQQEDWLFGYLGYDLKNYIEDLDSANPDPVEAPDLFFMVPGFLAMLNREGEVAKIIKGEIPEGSSDDAEIDTASISDLKTTVSKNDYLSNIREAQRRIAEGDFYEVNLSHQQQAKFSGSSYHLYRKMCDIGPVPFGAFLSFDDISVCSLTPERFLKKQGNHVFSQPIKGTIKRGQNADEDEKLKNKLQNSAKDRAENLMIVDLVRNDLSKIAQRNSVDVSNLFEVQTFGTIHQMVSTVSAKSDVTDPVEIIKACYPMGSMTGAPKISAMKTIEELENYKRGIYSGAIGYMTPEGDFDFNVVIRTAIVKNKTLYYSVGGAITGDSDPEQEWEETQVKAKALTDIL